MTDYPWSKSPWRVSRCGRFIRNNGSWIACMIGNNYRNDSNTQLIALAPEMAEAILELSRKFDDLHKADLCNYELMAAAEHLLEDFWGLEEKLKAITISKEKS